MKIPYVMHIHREAATYPFDEFGGSFTRLPMTAAKRKHKAKLSRYLARAGGREVCSMLTKKYAVEISQVRMHKSQSRRTWSLLVRNMRKRRPSSVPYRVQVIGGKKCPLKLYDEIIRPQIPTWIDEATHVLNP